jgi:hypothetical protein
MVITPIAQLVNLPVWHIANNSVFGYFLIGDQIVTLPPYLILQRHGRYRLFRLATKLP